MRPRLDAVHEVAAAASDKARALAAAENAIGELRGQLGSAQSALAVAQAEAGSLRARLSEAGVEAERANGRVAALVMDGEGLREAERQTQVALALAEARARDLEAELASAKREADGLINARCVHAQRSACSGWQCVCVLPLPPLFRARPPFFFPCLAPSLSHSLTPTRTR